MVLRLFRKSEKNIGQAPGTIIYTGDITDKEVTMSLTLYNEESIEEKEISINDLSDLQRPEMKWLNVFGIHNLEILEKMGDFLNIHPLVLEDIANINQHPKIEEYDDFVYVVLKMYYIDNSGDIKSEHLNFLLKDKVLVSFQEIAGDVFDPVRKRLQAGRKKIRNSNSDYLFYALMDTIVDNYAVITRKLAEKIDEIKRKITHNANQSNLVELDRLSEDVSIILHSIEPLEKIIPELEDYEFPFVDESNSVYFRDLQDHVNQTISAVNVIKDRLTSMNDYYLSVVSNRTNEVMKTLALVATLCVPITVIAGIYGMNFQNMPELSSKYGYPVVLSVMAGIGLSLFGYFKKKRWV